MNARHKIAVLLMCQVAILQLQSRLTAQVKPLPARFRAVIESELLPSYLDGDTSSILDFGSMIAQKVNSDRWDAVNAELKKHGIPDLGELLVNARMELLKTNYGGRMPRPSAGEIELTVPALKKEAEKSIAEINASPVMSDDTKPQSFKEFEDLLWKTHVTKNQLMNVASLINYGKGLTPKKPVKKTNDSEATNDLPEDVFEDVESKVALAFQNVLERNIELRLDRLTFARHVLEDGPDLKNRIKAAWAGDLDGYVIEQMLAAQKSNARPFLRERLQQVDLGETVKARVDAIRDLAGADLTNKSRALFTGMHWWLRGRYGKGPTGYGFLKNASALRSPREMFGLYMPTETPMPTAPNRYDSNRVPDVDRRHHYIWMFEYQRLYRTNAYRTFQDSKSRNRPKSVTELSRFY